MAPHGDFVNGVCLYGYLRRMEKDAVRLAFLLMRGESLEEIQAFQRWPPEPAVRTTPCAAPWRGTSPSDGESKKPG